MKAGFKCCHKDSHLSAASFRLPHLLDPHNGSCRCRKLSAHGCGTCERFIFKLPIPAGRDRGKILSPLKAKVHSDSTRLGRCGWGEGQMSSRAISVVTLGFPKGRMKNEFWAANSRQYSNTSSQNKHGARPKYPPQTVSLPTLSYSLPRQSGFSLPRCVTTLQCAMILREVVFCIIIILYMICLCCWT